MLCALAAGQGNVALGNGCVLLLQSALATTLLMADPYGLAVQPIALPANHGLRGLVLSAQAGSSTRRVRAASP